VTILIILAIMLCIWVGLYLHLKNSTGYSMDVAQMTWSFLNFWDRYCVLLRFVGWLTAGGIAAAVHSRNATGAYLLLAALLVNVILQALMLFWYEGFAHATYGKLTAGQPQSPYSAKKYATVLTLAVGELICFAVGAVLTVMMF